MAYDAYGRREPGYFDQSNQSVPAYTNNYSTEPLPSLRRTESSSSRTRSSPLINDKMASPADRDELDGHAGVSPELIAAITERITEKVKREVVEHLKTVEEQPKAPSAPPLQRAQSNKSSSTSSPPPTARRVYTPPSPTQSSKPMNVVPPSMEPVRSPPTSPLEKPSGVRFSDRVPPTRPAASRTYSTTELSTIDQKWGRLFDSEGTPTKRLGQFLRGLANHIIGEFPPKKSIVVTPSKMAAYYASHALEKEPHPLLTIFRAQSNEHICRLYQDLGCEHHLIQEDSHSAPIVPSLTPIGFAHWMTLFILAYPEEESRRFGKVVLAMPIDADGDLVDGKPERLPKQISRHLLPEREDHASKTLLETAILHFLDDLGSTNRRKGSITSPSLSRRSSTSQSRRHPVELHQTRTSPTSSKAQLLERERKPYTGAPSNSESSSNEESIRIERDRQPYTAHPGSGKVYTENSSLNIPSRPGRANSTSSRTSTREQPDIIEGRHQRTQSTASQNYTPGPTRPVGRRTSSPPLKSFSHSTPDDIHGGGKYGPNPSSSSSSFTNQSQGFNSGSYGSNTSFPPPPGPPPIDIRERDRRSRDERQYRRGTDEEIRYTGEFNSPKDAEKWDRYQEAVDTDRYERPYERGSVSIGPRDVRGAPVEDWYREKGRGPEYDTYGRRYA